MEMESNSRTHTQSAAAEVECLTQESSMRCWKSDSRAPSEGSNSPLSATDEAWLACAKYIYIYHFGFKVGGTAHVTAHCGNNVLTK